MRPLIEMLQSSDVQLREMSAFALGRLAQVSNFYSVVFFIQSRQYWHEIVAAIIPIDGQLRSKMMAV